MLTFDSHQLSLLVSQFFWPFIRVLALISTAPVTSDKQVSRKVKLGLGLMITFLIYPALPSVNISLFSVGALWLAIQQILIGAAIGFTMNLSFAAIRQAGEVIGLQMGLSFATFFDISSGTNTSVLARIFNLLAILLFLAFNGHLWLISLLVDSFYTLPIHLIPLSGNGFLAVAQTGGLIFINGLMLALPMITFLLILNMSLGMLNRMTPQLSIFVVGFPLTLGIGTLMIVLSMPMFAPFCEYLFAQVFDRLAEMIGSMAYF